MTIDATIQNTTDNNKTHSDVDKKAVRQAKTDYRTNRPSITLTNKINLKMTALVLEAHIACINSDNDLRRTLSQSLRLNFDIDAKYSDRD